jgi:hypothetical protein
MKTSSAKAKGRNLQKWVVAKLVEHLKVNPEDLESRPMGSSGEDVIMGVQTRGMFPYSIECKNQEKVNIWAAYEQSEANCGKYEPLVVIKKNRKKPLVVVDADYYIKLHQGLNHIWMTDRSDTTKEG